MRLCIMVVSRGTWESNYRQKMLEIDMGRIRALAEMEADFDLLNTDPRPFLWLRMTCSTCQPLLSAC